MIYIMKDVLFAVAVTTAAAGLWFFGGPIVQAVMLSTGYVVAGAVWYALSSHTRTKLRAVMWPVFLVGSFMPDCIRSKFS